MAKILTIGYAVAVATLLGTATSPAAETAAARGEVLARRWCAACHVVSADQTKASSDAPSFFALTGDRARTAAGLADFLLLPGTTHSQMPDLHLSRVEIADIVAYVVSLPE